MFSSEMNEAKHCTAYLLINTSAWMLSMSGNVQNRAEETWVILGDENTRQNQSQGQDCGLDSSSLYTPLISLLSARVQVPQVLKGL